MSSMTGLVKFMEVAARAFRERDVETLVDLTHPEAEIELFANGRRLVRGRDGAREVMEAAWSSPVYDLALHRFEQLSEDTILAVGSVRFGGPRGFSQRTAVWLWHIQEGMIRKARTFDDERAARRAAGALQASRSH